MKPLWAWMARRGRLFTKEQRGKVFSDGSGRHLSGLAQ